MNLHRVKQVWHYGWRHAGVISQTHFGGKRRLPLFLDILKAYRKYSMWSNEYLKESFWQLNESEKEEIGTRYKEMRTRKEAWVKDFYENRKFIAKWSRRKWENSPRRREKRRKAYAKRYNMGEGSFVEYGVEFSRQHHLDGNLSIGSDVLIAKNCFIDYSGDVTIKDHVQLTNGVIIETHHHAFHSDWKKQRGPAIPTTLTIEEDAVIGSRAIILSSCHYIGKHARIGAGAVVTHDVHDFEVVAGIPARTIKIMNP